MEVNSVETYHLFGRFTSITARNEYSGENLEDCILGYDQGSLHVDSTDPENVIGTFRPVLKKDHEINQWKRDAPLRGVYLGIALYTTDNKVLTRYSDEHPHEELPGGFLLPSTSSELEMQSYAMGLIREQLGFELPYHYTDYPKPIGMIQTKFDENYTPILVYVGQVDYTGLKAVDFYNQRGKSKEFKLDYVRPTHEVPDQNRLALDCKNRISLRSLAVLSMLDVLESWYDDIYKTVNAEVYH